MFDDAQICRSGPGMIVTQARFLRKQQATRKPRTIMRIVASLIAVLFAAPVLAKLPAATEVEKAQAVEAAAKSAWTDKVGLYQLCLAQDRTVAAYRASAMAAGKAAAPAVIMPSCADPGPYASPVTPPAAKPIEASGAHSPPEMAVSPPSAKATAAEIAGGAKK